MQFPGYRARRVRRRASTRALLDESSLEPRQLVCRLYVCAGKGVKRERAGVAGCYEYSADELAGPVGDLARAGVNCLLLSAVGDQRDELAKHAVSKQGALVRAIAQVRERAADATVLSELDPGCFTKDGARGIVQGGEIDNDATLELLGEMALLHGRAGADFVAPAAGMDGQVGWIRETLDEDNLERVGIVPCTAHFRSAFSAGGASPAGDRAAAYLLGPGNVREAIREATLDVEEGADMLMVRPALPFLDVVARISDEFELPILGFVGDGECALVDAAGRVSTLEREQLLLESLVAVRRAGADGVVTPLALAAARMLRG